MMPLKAFPFEKYEANKNDFVFYNFDPNSWGEDLKNLITQVCDRHAGIGADGIVFLFQDNAQKWEWRFFNSDGSECNVCGNAARCAALAISLHDQSQAIKQVWNGSQGQFEGLKLGPDTFSVHWPIQNIKAHSIPDDLMEELSALNDFGLASATLINIGVPHLVLINHEEWSPEHRVGVSPQLRSHPSLGAEGANVTWLSLKNLSTLTYERGVEAETFACGSGAIAAFLGLNALRLTQEKDFLPEVTFHFPGGALTVKEEAGSKNLWLSGYAKKVFTGTIDLYEP